MIKRDFLSLLDFSSDELKQVIERAKTLRKQHENGEIYQPLVGKTGALILTMSSTRTRVAFEAGFAQMGAKVIFLSPGDTQIGRGEPLEDLARVLSEMVDIIMIRTASQQDIETLAHYATVPVINAMSSLLHPCQLLADIQAFEELRGSIEGKTVTFLGDGYNMCHSYINAAKQWNFHLRFSCPDSGVGTAKAQVKIPLLGGINIRMAHVVAITQKGNRLALNGTAKFFKGLYVCQQLAGVQERTHGVDHRYRGVMGECLDVLLAGGADHDDVDHLRQHPSKIFQWLTAPNLRIARAEKNNLGPHLRKARFESHPGTRAAHGQDQRAGFAYQRLIYLAVLVLLAQRFRSLDHLLEFIRGKIQ